MESYPEYKNFPTLKWVAIWAGAIALAQSLIWIGLSLTGILAYNCLIDYSDSKVNYGTITQWTFFQVYFKGSCEPENYPTDIDFDPLKKISTTLNPDQVLIWMSVYLAVSFCWCLSSVSMMTLNYKFLRLANIILYIWVFLTLAISGMDLAHGIAYGLDYGKFTEEARNYNLAPSQAGEVHAEPVVLISAQIAAISMMIISLRGFVLWILNVGFLCYFFKETFVINEVVTADSGFAHSEFSSQDTNSMLATRPPIRAFETKNDPIFTNPAFEPDHLVNARINLEPAERAARMSVDNMHERRIRSLEHFQQYPPPKPAKHTEPNFPVPDYTPPMPRANQSSALKNSRFQ